jgi:hypothetical protein
VDDWFVGDVPEVDHDAFYEEILEGESRVVWDPFEHIVDYLPTLPSMEELGRYRTVLWTLDRAGGFLLPAQAESTYHTLEGFVRAGGNVILEGQSALSRMGGADGYLYEAIFDEGEFIHEHVGVDSLRNAGAGINPSSPGTYGYAFLGGVSTGYEGLPNVPVDTLDKWADGYEEYGGLPHCEIMRPLPGTRELYLFDAFVNEDLDGLPCATAHYADDGTGTFACFGFPFYYLETAPASDMLGRMLESLEGWQQPASLAYFNWDAEADSVVLSWLITPTEGPQGCAVERSDGGTGGYHALTDTLILPGHGGCYRFVDTSVAQSTPYLYRLVVTEQWGATTTHGPWDVTTPGSFASPWLGRPTPNPFFETMNVRFGVAADDRRVSVDVFDVSGRRVRTLRSGALSAGDYDASWDGTNQRGDMVANGVYFVRARIGSDALERKVVFLR